MDRVRPSRRLQSQEERRGNPVLQRGAAQSSSPPFSLEASLVRVDTTSLLPGSPGSVRPQISATQPSLSPHPTVDSASAVRDETTRNAPIARLARLGDLPDAVVVAVAGRQDGMEPLAGVHHRGTTQTAAAPLQTRGMCGERGDVESVGREMLDWREARLQIVSRHIWAHLGPWVVVSLVCCKSGASLSRYRTLFLRSSWDA